ncbi:MAG TPA: hypothetical protein VN915_04635 [Elusimicrobiota bacterium]|nr:hypothetical protein [Elusimicrobiota bacterium]
MAKTKGKTRGKPRARPLTPRKRARRTAAKEPPIASIPPATVHENESEDQLGAYGDQSGETDVIQP